MTETPSTTKYGTREQVYLGLAQMTRGKLTKDQLILDEKTNKYKSAAMVKLGKEKMELKLKAKAEAPAVERPSVREHVERIEKELTAEPVMTPPPVVHTPELVEVAQAPKGKHRRTKSRAEA